MSNHRWYVLHAYSGFEKKVVDSIKDELKKHKLSENLQEILVPTHQVTEVKKGKRTKKEKKCVEKKLYPSVYCVFVSICVCVF